MRVPSLKDTQYYPFLTKTLVFNIIAALVFCVADAQASQYDWQVLLNQGDSNLNQQKLIEAQDCFSQALKQIQHSPHSHDDMVKCIEKLASTLVLENKTDEALPLYNKSLHILERTYGKDSPKVIPTLFAFGSIYEAEGDPKIAMSYYKRALTINEKVMVHSARLWLKICII